MPLVKKHKLTKSLVYHISNGLVSRASWSEKVVETFINYVVQTLSGPIMVRRIVNMNNDIDRNADIDNFYNRILLFVNDYLLLLPKLAVILAALGYVISSVLAYRIKDINIITITTFVTINAAIISIRNSVGTNKGFHLCTIPSKSARWLRYYFKEFVLQRLFCCRNQFCCKFSQFVLWRGKHQRNHKNRDINRLGF